MDGKQFERVQKFTEKHGYLFYKEMRLQDGILACLCAMLDELEKIKGNQGI